MSSNLTVPTNEINQQVPASPASRMPNARAFPSRAALILPITLPTLLPFTPYARLGYRPDKRYLVFQVLPETTGVPGLQFSVFSVEEKKLKTEALAPLPLPAQLQAAIEQKLAARHLEQGGLALYDLTSSYFEGVTCPLAMQGHDREGKKGKRQVN